MWVKDEPVHPVVKNITALISTEAHVIPVREPERDLVNNANPALRVDIRHLSALLQESASPLARSVPEVVHGPRKPERNTNVGTSQRKGASFAPWTQSGCTPTSGHRPTRFATIVVIK